ncbi:MAG: NDP-sugar synthase [Polyangiales bacterium]
MRALVLSAGYGTRLGALTRETPKPLLPIEGVPLLVRTLQHLAAQGFRDVAVNLHFRGDLVRAALGDGAAAGVRVTWSEEPTLLGTAGAVRALRGFFEADDDESFLVLYGDLLLDEDLAPMLAQHRATGATATLLLHQRAGSNSLVQMGDDRRITGFVERPTPAQRARAPFPWVNSGVQVLHRRLIPRIPDGGPSDLPRDVYAPAVAAGEAIYGFPLRGYRCAIDSPARYDEAQAALREGRCRPRGPSR